MLYERLPKWSLGTTSLLPLQAIAHDDEQAKGALVECFNASADDLGYFFASSTLPVAAILIRFLQMLGEQSEC